MKQFSKKRRKYLQALQALPDIAKAKGIPVVDVAAEIVEEKKPEIRKYIIRNGYKPSPDTLELSLQAAAIHEAKIARKMKDKGVGYPQAENLVFQDEESQEAFEGEDYNDFAPGILAALGGIAGKAVQAINQKREQKGKKPILSGKFWNFLKSKSEAVEVAADGDDLNVRIKAKQQPQNAVNNSELAAGYLAARNELERQAKQDWIKKNLPLIILAVAALFFGIWYFTKKK